MTSTEQTVKTNAVVDLGDPSSHIPEQVGTKAANLAQALASDFVVPDGFIITTAACDRIHSAAHIPDDLWEEIIAHLRRLGDGPWAVRSSGVAEDLSGDSYAGLYESVLDVQNRDDLANAIQRCVASASSDRVRAYRGSDSTAPLAVLIQRMVPAQVAGVAFTANPISGDNEVLVSAVAGLGDRLVSGESTPDEWVMRDDDVTCVRSIENSLDETRTRDVAELAIALEHLFGSPQDVEWAIAGDQLFVLQTRPITALPVDPHLEAPTKGFWIKDTSHWPTPLTPFGASVYLPALSNAQPPMAEFGLLVERIEQRSIGGEVYVRAVPLGGKERSAPPTWAVKLAVRLAPPMRRRARLADAALTSRLPERYLDQWENEWRAAFAHEFRELKSIELRTLADDALLQHLDGAKDLLRRGADLHFRLVAPYDLALYELAALCHELWGWNVEQALALLTGTSVASSETGRELQALAQRVAADDAALEALSAPAAIRLTLLRERAPWVVEEFDDYLERYGHRTLNYDPGAPTWFERPDMVMALLTEQVRLGRTKPRETPERPDVLGRVRAELAGRAPERSRFEDALAYAQRAYAEREDNIFWFDCQPAALLRYCAVEIGRRLVERGVLGHAPDAVFLEESELRDALTNVDRQDLRDLVARRKAERAWVAAHPGPPSYGKDPGPPPDVSALPPSLRLVHAALFQALQLMMAPSTAQVAPNELRGVAASPGHFRGTVRVIRDETEFAKLQPGDVLVAPVTSPPWSVLFLLAGAVVTDGGGVLSHTAVIAREYGIPAVLATGEATRRLRDGDRVDVDGSTGVVSLVSPTSRSVDPTVMATQ